METTYYYNLNEIKNKINKIKYLNSNLRILASKKELNSLNEIITSNQYLNEEKEQILLEYNLNSSLFNLIIKRSNEIENIIEDTSQSLFDWILGSEIFGISTYYRVDEDGYLLLRMEGIQEIPIFEQLAVLYEVALFNQWMPFCTQSELLQQISNKLFYFFYFIFFYFIHPLVYLFVCFVFLLF